MQFATNNLAHLSSILWFTLDSTFDVLKTYKIAKYEYKILEKSRIKD